MNATTAEQPASEATASVTLCPLDEIPLGMGVAFQIGGRSIAIFRTRRGSVHAVDNVCPHRGAPLADGIIAGDQIVCPFHAFRFDLASGQCDQPGTCGIATYRARLVNGHVVIDLPSNSDR